MYQRGIFVKWQKHFDSGNQLDKPGWAWQGPGVWSCFSGILSNLGALQPLCHHYFGRKKRERGLIWKIVPTSIYQMGFPLSLTSYKQLKIDISIFLFLSSDLRESVLGSHCVAHIVSCWNHISMGPFKKTKNS